MNDTERMLDRLQRHLVMRDLGDWNGGAGVIYQFIFSSGGPIHLTTCRSEFRFACGTHAHPDITLFIDAHATLEALLCQRLNGMDAFMQGRYRADGNIMLSQLLLHQFSVAAIPDDPD